MCLAQRHIPFEVCMNPGPLDSMAYTCLIVLDPEIPFTLPEMKGISHTDGANYKVPVLLRSLRKFSYGYFVINYLLIIDISI